MSFSNIIASIANYARLSTGELDAFTSRLRHRKLAKGELLLDIGETCRDWGYIQKGSFRQYYVDKEFEEVTTNLFTENSWVLHHGSFTSQKPSPHKIEAFEDSEVLSITIHDIHDLISKSPSYLALGKILEQIDVSMNHRLPPDERYLQLMKDQPNLIKKFPLKYIASYLGMTSETLSRVRSKIR